MWSGAGDLEAFSRIQERFPSCSGTRSGAVVPAAALVTGMIMLDGPVAVALAGFAVSWLAAEAALARGAGWHLSRWFPLAWLVRETVMPLIWVSAILARDFRWRGNSIATRPALKDRTAP